MLLSPAASNAIIADHTMATPYMWSGYSKNHFLFIIILVALFSLRFSEQQLISMHLFSSNIALIEDSFVFPTGSLVEPNFTMAICHKSLFGTVELDRVQKWSQYHYDLGFDSVFIYHVVSQNIFKAKVAHMCPNFLICDFCC